MAWQRDDEADRGVIVVKTNVVDVLGPIVGSVAFDDGSQTPSPAVQCVAFLSVIVVPIVDAVAAGPPSSWFSSFSASLASAPSFVEALGVVAGARRIGASGCDPPSAGR